MERFAELKRKYGMNTHISLRNSWSEGNITDSINHYLNIDPDIEYVLFFGSHNDIPAQYNDTLSTTTSVLTDYNYATYKDVTNNTTYQRFYLGRIPVRSLDEANHVVDKIIDYSLTPPEDEDYYNRGTNIAYFEGANDGVTEYRGYVHCSEEIKEYLDSLGYSIQRVYSANVAMPLYFDNHILMPGELQYYNYN